jgi:hypothetical protein
MRSNRSPYLLLSKRRWIPLVLCCWLCQCVQTYVSPYKSPPTGYLVVEGYISANTPTQYSLTRTIELPGDSAIPAVIGASVQVQGSDSSVYALPDQGNGTYGDTTLSLNPAVQYRLSIHTPNGESYLSDFVPVKVTPPIDSVNWIYEGANGVNIYVNTHDPNNATRYYQWTYDQTWVYYSPEESFFVYDTADNTVVPRLSNQFNYRCWSDQTSSSLIIDNTSKLAQDIVYEYPLVNIPDNSIELSSLYSIQVSQFALTLEGYDFLSQMQVNTESLGSIFDVQPTELIGNIHCLNNPGEQVIGYISAGTVQQQRIFIAETQLPAAWEYYFECEGPNYVVPNNPDSLEFYFHNGGWMPLDMVPGGYTANNAFCIDCTFRGGSTQKPSFWPN